MSYVKSQIRKNCWLIKKVEQCELRSSKVCGCGYQGGRTSRAVTQTNCHFEDLGISEGDLCLGRSVGVGGQVYDFKRGGGGDPTLGGPGGGGDIYPIFHFAHTTRLPCRQEVLLMNYVKLWVYFKHLNI